MAGKRDPSKIDVPHPLLKDLVTETYGVLVYQEQVMEVARIIAGYTLGGADILRRAMGKKIASVMAEQKEIFIRGAKDQHGIDKNAATRIFEILEKFAQYGFNKSHSAAYAMLSYRTAFLKANYPVEFMAAVLSSELGNSDKVAHFIEECGSMGVPVLGPDINESRERFTPVLNPDRAPLHHGTLVIDGEIRFGLAAIKGVGDSPSQAILAIRDADGPFESFDNFLNRIDLRQVNKRTIECLVKAGAFDGLGEDRAELIGDVEAAIGRAQSAQRDREAGQAGFFDLLEAPAAEGEPAAANGNGRQARKGPALPKAELLKFEKELLGFYVSGHPLDPYGKLADALNSFDGEAFNAFPERTPFRLCGVVSNIVKRLTRRDNKPWAQFVLSTRKSSYQLTMFNEAFERMGHLLDPEKLVVVHGTTSVRDGEVTLRINELHSLDRSLNSLIQKVTWIVDTAKPEDTEAFLKTFRQSLDDQRGDVAVEFGFRMQNDEISISAIAGSLRWGIRPQNFQACMKHPAVIDSWIEPAGIPVIDDRPAWARNGSR